MFLHIVSIFKTQNIQTRQQVVIWTVATSNNDAIHAQVRDRFLLQYSIHFADSKTDINY